MELCRVCGHTGDTCSCNRIDVTGSLTEFPESPATSQAEVSGQPSGAGLGAQSPMQPLAAPAEYLSRPTELPKEHQTDQALDAYYQSLQWQHPAPPCPPPPVGPDGAPLSAPSPWPPPPAVVRQAPNDANGWSTSPVPPDATGSFPPSSYSLEPPYWVQPMTAPPARRRRGKSIAIVGAAVIGVLLVLGAVGAFSGNNKNGSNSHSPNPGAVVPVPGSPSTPAGFKVFRSTGDQFRIDLPESWKAVDPNSPGAQTAMNEMEQSNPAIRSVFASSAAQLVEKGIVLLAINPVADPDGHPSSVNVIALPDLTFSGSELSQIATNFPNAYAKMGGTITGTSYVTLSGHEALRFTGILPVNTPLGTRINVPETQYYEGANGFLYLVTLSGSDPNIPAIASSFSTD